MTLYDLCWFLLASQTKDLPLAEVFRKFDHSQDFKLDIGFPRWQSLYGVFEVGCDEYLARAGDRLDPGCGVNVNTEDVDDPQQRIIEHFDFSEVASNPRLERR